jgi:hypothetical protein
MNIVKSPALGNTANRATTAGPLCAQRGRKRDLYGLSVNGTPIHRDGLAGDKITVGGGEKN